MMFDDEFHTSAWHRKPGMWCARAGAFFVRRWRGCLALSLALGLCAVLCVASSSRLEIDPALALQSAHFVLPETDPSLFRWRGGVADANVSQTVVDARRGVALAKLIVLNPKHDIIPRKAVAVRCSDLLSLDASVSHAEVLHDMHQFVAANVGGASACACAPMFGKDIAYLMLASERSALVNPEQIEAAHAADGTDSEQGVYFEHLLNPVDEHQLAYDTLDAAVLEAAGIDLVVADETDDDRYNAPKGRYAVIRRRKIVLTLIDRVCHHERLTLSGSVALCAQHCLDIMRGISVRERAFMQHRIGINLNAPAFAVQPPQPTLSPAEVKVEL